MGRPQKFVLMSNQMVKVVTDDVINVSGLSMFGVAGL